MRHLPARANEFQTAGTATLIDVHRAAPGMKPLLVSILAVAAYRLGSLIPVPFSDENGFAQVGWAVPDIFALGLMPFLTCFLLVELFSLTPLGRYLRRGGLEGRATLNRAAVWFSVGLAALQAIGLALYLVAEATEAWSLEPGFLAHATFAVTLTAGSAVCYGLARWISTEGLGNGFSLLLAADIVAYPLQPEWEIGVPVSMDLELLIQSLPVLVVAALAFVLFQRGITRTAVRQSDLPCPITVKVPVFPQGVVPLVWASLLLDRIVPLFDPNYEIAGFWMYQLWQVSAILLLCWLGWGLFSSRGRLETNLSGVMHDRDALERTGRPQLVRAIAFMVVMAALVTTVEWYLLEGWGVPIRLFEVIVLVSVGADLLAEWRLRRRCESIVRLIELDNVYLATYLQGLLQSEGIDTVLRGYRHRSLFFFFLPLVKMDLLVPSSSREKATKILERLRPSII